MATDPPEGYGDDFLEQILAIPSYNIAGCLPGNTTDANASETVSVHRQQQQQQPVFPLGLSLDNGRETIGAFAGQQQQQQRVSFVTLNKLLNHVCFEITIDFRFLGLPIEFDIVRAAFWSCKTTKGGDCELLRNWRAVMQIICFS